MPAKKKSAATATTKRVPANETPAETFARLGAKRVTKTLNDLRLVSNLSRYAHTPEQGEKIINALREEVDLVEQRFTASPSAGKKAFTL